MSKSLISLDRPDVKLYNDIRYAGFKAYYWLLAWCEVGGFYISKPLRRGFDALNKMAAPEPYGFN